MRKSREMKDLVYFCYCFLYTMNARLKYCADKDWLENDGKQKKKHRKHEESEQKKIKF